MKNFLVTTAAAVAAALPAHALDVPERINPDEPHMRRQVYNPAGRTHLVLTMGRSAILTFGQDEQVKRVMFGTEGLMSGPKPQDVQGGGGQGATIGNNLPLWGDAVGVTTLQVITHRPGHPDRPYQFTAEVRQLPATCAGGLDTRRCSEDPDAVFGLTFVYPEDERQRRATAAAEARQNNAVRSRAVREQRETQTARDRLAVDFRCLNELYEAQGSASIVPDKTCDDGQATGFLFRGNRPVPAVFLIGADGKEQSVRPAMHGDWMVVPALRGEMRLRLGGAVLAVWNRRLDAIGRNPGTGTSSPDVIREVVEARSQ
ncbi:hypothetical protein GCM10009416_11530 [Craurococcus roseus]|uniref:Uncharacterized protein n=1 Tax=Craurococcus roseus TaxID=77585 RepID=A0ABN1EU68_9PROT